MGDDDFTERDQFARRLHPDYQIVIKVGVQNGFNEIRKIISSSQSKYKIISRALGNNSDGCNRWPMGMIFLYLLGKFLFFVYVS